jgi:transposase
MRQKSQITKVSSERVVKDIRRATRKQYSAEGKIRIVLDGLRGEHSIAELCGREGTAEGLYYSWSKEFLAAGKRRLAGNTARAATSGDVKERWLMAALGVKEFFTPILPSSLFAVLSIKLQIC